MDVEWCHTTWMDWCDILTLDMVRMGRLCAKQITLLEIHHPSLAVVDDLGLIHHCECTCIVSGMQADDHLPTDLILVQ